MSVSVDVVVPTTRPSTLARLLLELRDVPGRVIVVDGRGRSPAAARNEGWRSSTAEWVAFLDDDVVPEPGWHGALVRDLEGVGPQVAGSQGRIRVPRRASRRPTDWERSVGSLEDASWATADMAYRRDVLEDLGGFDERFRRAYREDADLALRVLRAGYELERGARRVLHPVGKAGPLVSIRKQVGNADDVLMRAKHGPRWRAEAGAPRGRLRRHALVTAGAAAALAGRRAGRRRLALAGATLYATGVGELALARIGPGPRTGEEVATMVGTSAVLPVSASWHALRGWVRHGRLAVARRRTRAVLVDRDGTLVEDVPYNDRPDRVRLLPGTRQALARLRAAGIPVAVITNQSGVGRGILSEDAVEAVNARVEELAGPFDEWLVCPHAPDAGCECRKPGPELVVQAAECLGVPAGRCVVIGDIGSDVEAAAAAGARSILVPTARTLRAEVERAPVVAPDLTAAVDLVLGDAA